MPRAPARTPMPTLTVPAPLPGDCEGAPCEIALETGLELPFVVEAREVLSGPPAEVAEEEEPDEVRDAT